MSEIQDQKSTAPKSNGALLLILIALLIALAYMSYSWSKKNKELNECANFNKELEAEMMGAAEEMEFERAAALRDEIQRLKEYVGKPLESVPAAPEKNGPQTKSRRGRRPGAKQ